MYKAKELVITLSIIMVTLVFAYGVIKDTNRLNAAVTGHVYNTPVEVVELSKKLGNVKVK